MCADDAFEDNDAPEQARVVEAGATYDNLQICAYDVDWPTLDGDAECSLTARIAFDGTVADLDLTILDGADGFTGSYGVGESEEATLDAVATGPMYIQVFGHELGQAPYSLEVMVVCPR